jgi:putative nucleotidyltransferase with HDIG domain
MISREESWKLVTDHLKTGHLLKHVLATEACMKALAEKLGEDETLWGVTGLVHDMDLDDVEADPVRHGKFAAELLQKAGFPDELVGAVLAHAGHRVPETKLDMALYAVDPTTGFIVAVTLVRPDKKISGVEVRSIVKRMKEKRFAANVNRDQMRTIEKLGMDFEQFLGTCLGAMQRIAADLGL